MDAGTDWVASQGRYALDFDGSNDHIQLPLVPFLGGGNLSITAWVRQASADQDDHAIKFGTATTDNAIGIFKGNPATADQNKLKVGLHANTGSEASTTTDIAAGRWYHIAANVAPTRREIWLDGRLEGASTATVNYNITSTFANIASAQSALVPWLGQLSDIAIYNRALYPNEIRILASRPGIAYEMIPSQLTGSEALIAAYRARQYSQIIGGGVI
jgi:hypothetical protein